MVAARRRVAAERRGRRLPRQHAERRCVERRPGLRRQRHLRREDLVVRRPQRERRDAAAFLERIQPVMHTMRTRNQGFTLLELMIAMAIGLLLTLIIGTLFVQSRRTYLTTDDVSRMQENMRFAY